MKDILNGRKRMAAVPVLGVLSFVLRRGLYAFGLDEKGLLLKNHPLEVALWAVSALVLAMVLAAARGPKASEAYEDNFRESVPALLGHVLGALGIALTVLLNPPAMSGPVGQLWRYAGMLSAVLLAAAGFCRGKGSKPFFLGYGLVSVFFALHLVCHYQIWCSDPQLQNYVFAFCGNLTLMLFAYYQAAACVGMGRRKMLRGVGLTAAYLCIVNLANTEYLFLYLGCGIWAATGSCRPEAVSLPSEKAGGEDVSA